MERVASGCSVSHPDEPLRALLLGVTPEIAGMRWPEKSSLLAVDRSFPMTQAVWPGNLPGKRSVVCANWLALPQQQASRDVVIGDGSINSLEYASGFQALAESVFRVLRRHGILILRCYVQPAAPETPEAVFADASRGLMGSFHAFKLRLLMAAQESAQRGVAVKDVYRLWVDRNLDRRQLPAGVGWEKSAVETIEFYREAGTVYAFPTVAQLRATLLPWFDEVSMFRPTYQLGDRCPTFVFRPRTDMSGEA